MVHFLCFYIIIQQSCPGGGIGRHKGLKILEGNFVPVQVRLWYQVNMKISVVSGGFDPIHSGHISYLKEASEISNKLVVCLNSDVWLAKKKGNLFCPSLRESVFWKV